MTGRIDITCSLPAPTLVQVRAWLTRTGWTECQDGKAIWPVPRWTPPGPPGHAVYIYDIAFASSETLQDIARALGEPHTPEAVYREIVGPVKVWALCHQDGSTPDLFASESRAVRARGFCAGSRVEECEVQP